jgi:hypothetical protein
LIPQDDSHVYNRGLSALKTFRRGKVRGRFIALYLGLRRMHDAVAPLGSGESTSAGEIERFLDRMFTKTHRKQPFVVLTAPFGGSNSPNAPYSAPTSVTSPGRGSGTNTWRNNFQVQKGIGCPAAPQLVESLLANPRGRLACPHMVPDPKEPKTLRMCALNEAKYRGDKHSIWLRHADDGYQVVDLDLPGVYEPYLLPGGDRIPAFALIAALYGFAPPEIYPQRETVRLDDFADDFHFGLEQVAEIFDVDLESPGNAAVLAATQLASATSVASRRRTAPSSARSRRSASRSDRPAGELPPEADPILMNTGLGAERLVAQELVDSGWEVRYRGSQRNVGFDLEAQRDDETLSVEVKSSVEVAQPELTQSEWIAAQALGESYILAIVDFYGSGQQRIWYIRNPAGSASVSQRSVSVFRVKRGSLDPHAAKAKSL